MTFDSGLAGTPVPQKHFKSVRGKKEKRKREGRPFHWVLGYLLSIANALTTYVANQILAACCFCDLWKDEGKGRNSSIFANCKSMTTQKNPTELVKMSRAISKEGPVEDLGLHLGWAYAVRWALNMRGGSAPEGGNHKAGIKVEHQKVQEVDKQGCTVVLGSEEKCAHMRQAAAHLLNASTVSPPCRPPCRTSPHRILLRCASPSYVFQFFTHTHKSCDTRMLGPKLQNR